ncbi:MAG: S-layer homology domain-containing protein [Firmicutes bacterium]|nr:S-layer homology domain-containing protein [Bacillota bacterium]
MKRYSIKKTASWLLLTALLLACAGFGLSAETVYAEGGPVITKQPESVEVAYPDGASFHVEVEDPDSVASYQWQLTDGYNLFVLQGTSAKTDTLVIPATEQDTPDMAVSCIITDKDGNTVESDPAMITVTNAEVDKTVLYVGDHAVEPGETLDLADTTMGSGTVAFDADGVNITFTDFRMDNTVMLYDRQIAASTGVMLVRRRSVEPEYFFHFEGQCEINNTFYDAEYNSAGIDINAFFASGDDADHPTIVLTGGENDSLTLKGGSNAVYTDGNVEIGMYVKTVPNGEIFMDGIRCNTLVLDKDARVELGVNGTGVFTLGDLRLFESAFLDIESRPVAPSVGPAAKNLIMMGGSLYADNAGINIDGYGDPDRYPEGKYLAMMNGIGMEGGNSTINLKGSYLNVFLHGGGDGEPFAVNFNGIIGNDDNCSLVMEESSSVHVTVDAPNVEGCAGLVLGSKCLMDGGSRVEVYVTGAGETHGVEIGRDLEMKDSQIRSEVVSTTDGKTYGVVCGSAVIEGGVSGLAIESKAPNGLAFAADTGDRVEEAVPFEEGYEPVNVTLKDVSVQSPEGAVFSPFAVPGYASYIKAEAVFDPADTYNPAQEVVIGAEGADFPFEDVAESDYFRKAVEWAYKNGVTGGKTATTFAPADLATRAQMMTFLWVASGKPEPETTENPFKDVAENAYYYKPVLWAVENGITAGVSADEFGPDRSVTRAQAMTFLYGAVGRPEAELAADAAFFEDVKDTDYFAAPVAWAYTNGITSGKTKTLFGPNDPCTRAQIVTFLYLTFAE